MNGRRYAAAALAAALLGATLGACSGDGGDHAAEDTEETAGEGGGVTTTTMNTGGLAVTAPDGWQPIPAPDIGIGFAVPPGWEATLLSPEGLATLAGASPAVPGFTELAHAAAAQGGVIYAAGEDQAGGISDVVVRATPATGVTDAQTLRYAAELTAANNGTDPTRVTVVDGAQWPMALVPFTLGAVSGSDGRTAEARSVMVAGPGDILWEVTVTADDAASLDGLTEQIRQTLTFAPPSEPQG